MGHGIMPFTFNVFYAYTVNEHYDLGVTQLVTACFDVIGRVFERPGFETFVIEDEPTAGPVQQFDLVAGFVYEDIDIPVCRWAVQVVPDQAAQPVETLAHVGRFTVQVEPQ